MRLSSVKRSRSTQQIRSYWHRFPRIPMCRSSLRAFKACSRIRRLLLVLSSTKCTNRISLSRRHLESDIGSTMSCIYLYAVLIRSLGACSWKMRDKPDEYWRCHGETKTRLAKFRDSWIQSSGDMGRNILISFDVEELWSRNITSYLIRPTITPSNVHQKHHSSRRLLLSLEPLCFQPTPFHQFFNHGSQVLYSDLILLITSVAGFIDAWLILVKRLYMGSAIYSSKSMDT